MPRDRKSLSDHALTGTTPQYVLPDSDVSAGRPKYPRGISGDAKSVFKRLVKTLEARRTLTPGDQEILRLYSVLYDRHAAALLKINEQGVVCVYNRVGAGGEAISVEKPNLHLKIAETCESKMLACLVQLGLTPGTRGKIKQTEEKKAPDPNAHVLSRETDQPVVDEEIDLESIDLEQIQ